MSDKLKMSCYVIIALLSYPFGLLHTILMLLVYEQLVNQRVVVNCINHYVIAFCNYNFNYAFEHPIIPKK